MAEQNVVIPKPVLDSVEMVDELQDWLTANNPKIVAELRDARREDLAGAQLAALDPVIGVGVDGFH